MQAQSTSGVALFLFLTVPSGKQTNQMPVLGSLTVVKGFVLRGSLPDLFILLGNPRLLHFPILKLWIVEPNRDGKITRNFGSCAELSYAFMRVFCSIGAGLKHRTVARSVFRHCLRWLMKTY